MVYFHIIYVFRDETLQSILKFVKVAPFPDFSHPHPPRAQLMKITHLESFHFLFFYIFNSFCLFFTLLTIPPPPSTDHHFTCTTEQSLKPLLKSALNRELKKFFF